MDSNPTAYEKLVSIAKHNTYKMVKDKLVIFRCCECRILVEKIGVPLSYLSGGTEGFYVRWFSLCDECRRKRELSMLKHLPEIITAICEN